MKHFATLSFVALASLCHAQCTWNADPNGTSPYGSWITGGIRPDGGIMGAMCPQQYYRSLAVQRIAPDGTVIWSKPFAHLDPITPLYGRSASLDSEGSLVLFGSTSPHLQYFNQFALKVDSAGALAWARFYMLDSTYQQLGGEATSLARVSDGSYRASFYTQRGVSVSKLDDQGVPVWTRRFETHTVSMTDSYMKRSVLDPDGGLLATGEEGVNICAVHVSAQGVGDWAYVYDLGVPVYTYGTARMANGDYIITGQTDPEYGLVMRISSAGAVLWIRTYDLLVNDGDVAELPNGDILIGARSLDANLLQLSSAGDPLGTWTSNMDYEGFQLVGVRGDSVLVQSTQEIYSAQAYPGFMIADNTASMSCGMTATSINEVTAPSVQNITDTLVTIADSLKSWTMAMIPGPAVGTLDVESFVTAGPARPGYDVLVYGGLNNFGDATSGPVTATLTFDPQLTYVDAQPAPTSVVGNTITWTGLPPLTSNGSSLLFVDLNVPVALPIGTPLMESFTCSQDSTELSLTNNAAAFSHTVTGSFDPNDKFVRPQDYYNIESDSLLDYTIQFQNTGNDTAFLVVVRDTLPLDVDARTFRPGAASHPYTYSLSGDGILTFTFAHINLPDSNTNEAASHGLVSFRIAPVQPLALGTTISNVADIFFDFNTPVRTPAASVVVTDATGIVKPAPQDHVELFPLPAQDRLTVMLPPTFTLRSAFAIDARGRQIELPVAMGAHERTVLSVSHLAPGSYVLTLYGIDGRRLAARFTKD